MNRAVNEEIASVELSKSKNIDHADSASTLPQHPSNLIPGGTHRRFADQELSRRRSNPLNDGWREHGGEKASLGPVFAEGEAKSLLRGGVVAAEELPCCSGQRASFGCFGARAMAFGALRRWIRARLVHRRWRLVHSLISKEQHPAIAIPRISPTKSADDECHESVAGIQSHVRPRTDDTEVAFIGRPAQRIDITKSLPISTATPKSPSSTDSVSTSKHSASARFSTSSMSSSRSRAGRFVNADHLAGEGMDPGSILVTT